MKKTKILILSVLALTLIISQGCNSSNSNAQSGPVNNDENLAEQIASSDKEKSTSTEVKGTINLTKAEFLEKVMNYEENPEEWVFMGDKPCVIDFYADWCAPCRTTSPILEELAAEYGDKINIYKVDTEKERELAGVFGIQSIPSFLYCPTDGKPFMASGIARTEEETKQMFRDYIDVYLLKTRELEK
ncbi:MAG: thioredoxin domain-containing protein [Bacteroidota bacterium]